MKTALLARLLIAGVLAIALLASSYAALTHRRYGSANGAPGEIMRGHSVGQSFVSRYPDLSGIELWVGTYREEAGPARASLVLHLREGPQSVAGAVRKPGEPGEPSRDLATATLPAGAELQENPWYLFSFPAQHDSQNKAYYVEVESPDGEAGEALTLFWWQPPAQGAGDPYRDGQAYLDGSPRPGDFAIGFSYSPSPLDAWAQMLRAASANFPAGAMVAALLLLIAPGAVGTALWWLRMRRKPEEGHGVRTPISRLSLPLVLLIALANGLIYLLAVPPWQGPDEHAHFAYASLLDRYDLDAARVRKLEPAEYADLGQVVNDSMDLHDFSRRVSWHSAPGATANAQSSLLWEADQPPAYYWLCALTLRALRAVGVSADPFTDPESALRIMRGVSLLLSLGVVALAWVAGALLSRQQWLRLLIPLTVALLPMHAFVASTANNDMLAELSVSFLFVCIVALLKSPFGPRGLALAALCAAATVASAPTKASALAAAVPLLAFGLLVWIGVLVTQRLRRWKGTLQRIRHPLLVPGAAVALLLLLAAAVPAVALTPKGTAAGWNLSYWPAEYAARVRSDSAHDGLYVLQVGGEPQSQGRVAKQVLVPPVYHPALRATFSGWARLAERVSAPETLTAMMRLLSGSAEAGSASAALPPSSAGEWVHIEGTARIPEGAARVTMQLLGSAGGVPLQFDSV